MKPNAISGSTRQLPVVFIVALFACAAGFFVYFPLTNTDIWWHLAAGREMVKQGAFLRQDPFSYTNPGASWVDLHWLFQLCVYGLYKTLGLKGLVLLKCVLVSALCFAAAMINRSGGSRLYTALLIALLMFEARFLVLARPVLVTLGGLWFYQWSLERYAASGRWRQLFWLLPAQVIWVNCQGLFILGPVMAGLYWLDALYGALRQRTRPEAAQGPGSPLHLACLLAGVTAVSITNPYGVKGLFFPFKLFGRIDPSFANLYSRNVSENMPLFLLTGQDRRLLVAVLAVTGIYLVSLILNPKALKARHVLVTGAFFGLACMAKRNVLLYFFVMAPVLGHSLSLFTVAGGDSGTRCTRLKQAAGLWLLAIALPLLMWDVVQHNRTVSVYPAGPVSPFRVPVFAVRYLNENPVSGNIFNSIRYGGYLIWKRYPDHRVFIDGRLIIRSPAFFASYLDVLDKPESFDTLAARYNITHALLPVALFPRYLPLAVWLYHSDRWNLEFIDGASALFVRRGMGKRPALDLGNRWYVNHVRGLIAEQWPRDDYIRREALAYLDRFRSYLGFTY